MTQSLPTNELASAPPRIVAEGTTPPADDHWAPPLYPVPGSKRARVGQIDWWPLAADVAALALAIVLTSLDSGKSVSAALATLYGLVVVLFLASRRSYASRVRLDVFDDVRTAVTATASAAMAVIAFYTITSSGQILAGPWVQLWAASCSALVIARVTLSRVVVHQRRAKDAGARTIIVGAGLVGHLTAQRLFAHPELGLRPIGFLDKDPIEVEGESSPIPVLGASWDIERAIVEHQIDCVVVTFSNAPHDVFLRILDECERLGVRSLIVPRLFERVPSRFAVTHTGGLPLIEMYPSRPNSLQYTIKYAVDRVVAAIMLVLLAPLLAAIAITVAYSLGRPILYRQKRIGRDGREFEMLKFRTMLPQTEADEQAVAFDTETAPGGVEGVDRRTKVGSFLRRSSLDELAQLFNVLKGEMSLVGPRPERPEFVEYFGENVHRYDARHRVKSGVTGWAQVHRLRGKTSIADRVEWDNYYIENFSLWLDLKILFLTIPEVFGGTSE